MNDTPLAALFANRNPVKREVPTDGQVVFSPWTTPRTSEQYWDYLLGPRERPEITFPATPTEIEAILPKACTTDGASTIEDEAL
jgi:hypothetical protein